MAGAPVLGIDFSGARDAGRRIWIASGALDDTGAPTIARCIPASELPGGAVDRATAHAAVVRAIAEAPAGALIGCDFPFALPAPLMPVTSWAAFVEGFAERYPDAASFRTACVRAADGSELKRACDRAARTPFCVYNLRLYRQTWHGVADVLAPLVRRGRVAAPPMLVPPGRHLPIVLEACPASLLKAEALYRRYKGIGEAFAETRRDILGALAQRGALSVPAGAVREVLIADAGGDALDAVLAALAAARARYDPRLVRPLDPVEAIEGWVAY